MQHHLLRVSRSESHGAFGGVETLFGCSADQTHRRRMAKRARRRDWLDQRWGGSNTRRLHAATAGTRGAAIQSSRQYPDDTSRMVRIWDFVGTGRRVSSHDPATLADDGKRARASRSRLGELTGFQRDVSLRARIECETYQSGRDTWRRRMAVIAAPWPFGTSRNAVSRLPRNRGRGVSPSSTGLPFRRGRGGVHGDDLGPTPDVHQGPACQRLAHELLRSLCPVGVDLDQPARLGSGVYLITVRPRPAGMVCPHMT